MTASAPPPARPPLDLPGIAVPWSGASAYDQTRERLTREEVERIRL